MPNPLARLRDAIPPRLLAPFRRRWHWKDVTIALLGVAVFVLSIVAFGDRLSAALPSWLAFGRDGEPVAVFDVVLDREGRQFVDILFDRPLGEGRVDEILEPAPATIEPALGGTWKWQDTNALRFQPSGGFPMASELTINLNPERLLKEGQSSRGMRSSRWSPTSSWSRRSTCRRSRRSRARRRSSSAARSASTTRSIPRCWPARCGSSTPPRASRSKSSSRPSGGARRSASAPARSRSAARSARSSSSSTAS